MRKIFITLMFTLVVFSYSAFGCALSCAAICALECQGTPQSETGCGDVDYARSLQSCCEQAYRNNPDIAQAACGVNP